MNERDFYDELMNYLAALELEVRTNEAPTLDNKAICARVNKVLAVLSDYAYEAVNYEFTQRAIPIKEIKNEKEIYRTFITTLKNTPNEHWSYITRLRVLDLLYCAQDATKSGKKTLAFLLDAEEE